MKVLRVENVLAQSAQSWEDAVQQAVREACKSIKKIHSVYVKDLSVKLCGEEIKEYRANVKITFEIE